MVEMLDSVCQFDPSSSGQSMHLLPHLICSSRLLISDSANSVLSFSLLNDSSLRKCFSLKSFKYLSSLHVSNAVPGYFSDFSNVLDIRQSSTDIVSSYIDLKPSLCILKLSPFVRVLTRPNGTSQLRLTGTLPNLKQVKLDVVPNTFDARDQADAKHLSDSKVSSVFEQSPVVKRSRRNSPSNVSLLSNEESLDARNKHAGRAPKSKSQIYSLRDNFKLREILRSLRFVFRKNKLLRECKFDRFQRVTGIGQNWVLMQHQQHTKYLQEIQLADSGCDTQDKHKAMYLKRKLEKNQDVVRHMRSTLPRNVLYKSLVSRLRNKNDIVLYSKFFARHLVVDSVWAFLFGVDSKYRDLLLGFDQASYGSQLITGLSNEARDFHLRYSPNISFFVSKTQLLNEAFPVVQAILDTFQSEGKDIFICCVLGFDTACFY